MEKDLVNGVVFDGGGEGADDVEQAAAEGLVPAEVALDVDACRTEAEGLPDGHAGLHAGGVHLVALGDDAGALVAQDAHRLASEERVADALRADVKGIGVEVADRGEGAHGGPDSRARGWGGGPRQLYMMFCTVASRPAA